MMFSSASGAISGADFSPRASHQRGLKSAPLIANLTSLALKSRAKLTRSLPRPGKRWLHYFSNTIKAGLISRGHSATEKTVVAIIFQGPRIHGQIPGAANAVKNFAQAPLAVKPNLTFGH